MSFDTDLIKMIRERRGIPLDEFMQRCNDYYYNTQEVIGSKGDFITAPEVSQIFGEIVGAWLVDIMGHFGSGEKITLLECGPGRGTLMSDVLRVFSKFNVLNDNLQVILLESSSRFITSQKEALKDFNVEWIEDIHSPVLKESTGPLFILGNEFLDALPIKKYAYTGGRWTEVYVTATRKGKLEYDHRETDFAPVMKDPRERDSYEISPVTHEFINSVLDLYKAREGAMLWIDYDFAGTPFRSTFQAVKRHRASSPFHCIGASDLTAHVNFNQIKEQIQKEGLETFGPVTQRNFLRECGVVLRANALKRNATPEQAADVDKALQRLIAPKEMGILFKVMAAATKPLPAAGFGEAD